MPFDVTQYSEIKQLLPNHHLSVNGREAIRFINSAQSQVALTVDEATELAVPLIEAMCEFYKLRFKIQCPITCGRDSRVVYAEAMTQRLPVVYTQGQGFDGQFEEGEVGFHVKADSPVMVAEAILRIMKNYDDISSRTIDKAKKFSWDLIIQQYIVTYKQILT